MNISNVYEVAPRPTRVGMYGWPTHRARRKRNNHRRHIQQRRARRDNTRRTP